MKRDLKKDSFATGSLTVLKPLPICKQSNEVQNKGKVDSCENAEKMDGIEISGSVHEYELDNLQPEMSYEISIRACAFGLVNGCGRATSIVAETKNWWMKTL